MIQQCSDRHIVSLEHIIFITLYNTLLVLKVYKPFSPYMYHLCFRYIDVSIETVVEC